MSRHILFLDHAPALGGAERSLLLILKYLDRTRFSPHLACTGGPLAEKARALGVATHTVSMPRLRRSARFPLDWLTGASAIARVARQTGAECLYANTVRAATYAAPAARLARVPFVWHMRDFYLSESRPRHPWADRLGKRLLCATARAVIANSHAVASHVPCAAKVAVVHNGIEVDLFDPALVDDAAFRQRFGIPPDVPLVGTVGRLRPWKGQDRFLRAMRRVADEFSRVWFLVVGGDPFGVADDYPRQLRELAVSLGLTDRTVFTGHLDDVRPALAAMEVFVHPGEPEPFGLVNIEAMAMGRPVVGFAHGALPEIVADGETGVLVPPGDEGALAEAIVHILRNPSRSTMMGRAARERVTQCFTVQAMVTGVTQVLERELP